MRKMLLIPLGMFLLLAACKKQTSDSTTGNVRLLDTDPSVDKSYGQKINLKNWGGGSIAVWGRSSDELIAVTPKGIVQINLANGSTEKLTDAIQGFITQRDNGGNEVIFVGTVGNEQGYYRLNLSTKAVTKVLSLTKDQGSIVNLYNQYLFVYIGTSVQTGRPCSGIWDFWCGTSWTLVDTHFFQVNTTTNTTRPLEGLSFVTFSKDGTKALLAANNSNANGYQFYVFDNRTQTVADSLVVPYTRSVGNFYWNTKLLYATNEINTNDIVVIDALADQQVSRFHSSMNLFLAKLFWSTDGTKLVYGASCKTGDCKYALNELDLTTGVERKLVTTASTAYLTNPFSPILLSDDNKKLAFGVDDAWYLKSIQ